MKSIDVHDQIIKIIVIGDSNVGKTAILKRFCQNKYSNNIPTTIGLQYAEKPMVISGKKVLFQIWDTPGQQKFRTITPSLYKSAMGILLVYSVDDRNSFNSIAIWKKQIETYSEQNTPVLLLSNKADLVKKQVSQKQSQALSEAYKLDLLMTSSKDNINIDQSMIKIYQKIKKQKKFQQKLADHKKQENKNRFLNILKCKC